MGVMMLKHNILKVATVTPKLQVGKPLINVVEMEKVLKETKASLVLFPELGITGYTCGDLFYQEELLKESLEALKRLINLKFPGVVVVGMPLDVDSVLYNVAVVIQKDKILGVVPKYYLPNTGDFYDKRWFNSAMGIKKTKVKLLNQEVPFGQVLFKDNKNDINFAIEICEDMWVPITPGNLMSLVGANLILNLSASSANLDKKDSRRIVVQEHSRKNHGAYLYTSSGSTESTSEVVFSGHNIHAVLGSVVNERLFDGLSTMILESDIDFGLINYQRRKSSKLKDSLHKFDIDYTMVEVNFSETEEYVFSNKIDAEALIGEDTLERFEEIRNIQTKALMKRLEHINQPKIVLGVSGGLDSSLALLVAVDTFKQLKRELKDIIAVSMPGLATSERTKTSAKELSLSLGVTYKEIDIKDETLLHFEKINQDEKNEDITYENTQARIRTMTLMNLANQENGIVLGTGSLSEIALGFMTYNADQMSMYAINAGLPKTLVRRQFRNYSKIFTKEEKLIERILDTPVSPELKKNQKTEEFLGSYDINDYLIYRHLVAGDSEEKMVFMLEKAFELNLTEAKKYVKRFLDKFYNSQFKRQVMPDGPKVISIGLSPRSDYKMGSDVRKR